MSFSSDTSSPLSIIRTPSPTSDFQPSESECQEDSPAPERSEAREVNPDPLLPPNAGATHTSKRRNPHPSSWVWGPPESPNGKSVIVNDIAYWQCVRCPQKYPKVHGTRNPGTHLARVHSIHEERSAKFKRLKQAQQSIQMSMEETRRTRGSQRNRLEFPLRIAELSETLYGSDTYAARHNRVRARAAKADRRVAKAARELIMPTPFVRGTKGCDEAWRTLEKCWGAEIVDKAKAEVGLAVEGREGAGNRASEGSPPTQPSPSSHAPN
ncbi:hypothetical protein B9Z19DRAFT_1082620 [Tuber borchii]|uniref:BED-type domain-containing protein n=1 Tax=Tuber borchii TaxID=42251 RepID=A0A2T6ZU94_TUBBO|nr:hypothetical protein B9Z19DRAFT_1082620 [Tuber borchii]